MTRLLVSVRTLDEALLAAAAGVDLIDVKEPTRGPLGMADVEVLRAISQQLGNTHRLSAACGELRAVVDGRGSKGGKIAHAPGDALANYLFAKIGLAGCAELPSWREDWLAWRTMLPAHVEPVLVCYADGECCGAPDYAELIDFARTAKVRWMLFDTWDKRGPGLCELWQAADFLRLGQELRRAGISYVLAGKLKLNDVAGLSNCRADYLGIRGAVCESNDDSSDLRCGRLSSEKIKSWQAALKIRTVETPPRIVW
jgi:(5-formylfuran-3-yl)methyl phosphate synthase